MVVFSQTEYTVEEDFINFDGDIVPNSADICYMYEALGQDAVNIQIFTTDGTATGNTVKNTLCMQQKY